FAGGKVRGVIILGQQRLIKSTRKKKMFLNHKWGVSKTNLPYCWENLREFQWRLLLIYPNFRPCPEQEFPYSLSTEDRMSRVRFTGFKLPTGKWRQLSATGTLG